MMNLENLKSEYNQKEDRLKTRADEFKALRDADDRRLFQELVFVLLTSQSSALNAWDAVKDLDSRSLLLDGSKEQISRILASHEIQYERNKADYIIKNRKMFSQPTLTDPSGELKLRNRISTSDPYKTRKWFAENVHGIGWKGASHFLRNIGYGEQFAIVSGYVAKKLFELELVDSPDTPKNEDEYLKMEDKFKSLAEELEIPLVELDLLLWSMETGEIFK